MPGVVVVGSGFAGWYATRRLQKLLPDGTPLTLVSPTDYLLYTPLLPTVATGALDPRSLAVPLHSSLRRTRLVLGSAREVDVDRCRVSVERPDGGRVELTADAVVLAPGSVTRTLPIDGLVEHGYGLKTLPEAVALRDHVLEQLDLADGTEDPAERRARATFVVVGAGYAGTELAAQMVRTTRLAVGRWPRLKAEEVRWLLLDVAERVMPELGEHLGDSALALLRQREVEVRLGTGVEQVTPEQVTLSDGDVVPTRTLVWCAGVEASPLVQATGLPLAKGRLVADDTFRVGGRDRVFALGDAAAVPDRTGDDGAVCPPTAQHAQRQGATVAANVAAALSGRPLRHYAHHDLGLVVDLGGPDAAAKPLGVPLRGRPAKAVTVGYHLFALPTAASRVRAAADLLLSAALPPQDVQYRAVEYGRSTLQTEPA